MLIERAYAKLNLTLEVLRKRSDGYHDIISIVQTVDLFDTLSFSPSDDLTLDCDDEELPNESNLVLQAAEALRSASGVDSGARIGLDKRIPVSAGLGGGSADAAATLRGLNKLWGLGLNTGELAEIAESVGADVPFLVEGGPALMQGKGEKLKRLPAPRFERIVILVPEAKLAVAEKLSRLPSHSEHSRRHSEQSRRISTDPSTRHESGAYGSAPVSGVV